MVDEEHKNEENKKIELCVEKEQGEKPTQANEEKTKSKGEFTSVFGFLNQISISMCMVFCIQNE